MSQPTLVYKIATSESLQAGSTPGGNYAGMPIDYQDGYIHLSTASQLSDTLRLHFAGQSNLVLLAVDSERLGTALKWEPSRGGQLFPHLYAPLPLGAVAWRAEISVDRDGRCDLPEAVA
jgi:uncharacterized protein (DUF952 family)